MYEESLNNLLEELEKHHICLYFAHTKEEVLNYKNELIINYSMNNACEFIYVAKLLISYISDVYDQHTFIKQTYNPSPYIYRYIDDKLYIIDGADENNYKYVKKINGVAIETLVKEYIKTICTPSEERLKSQIENLVLGFNNLFIVRGLPSINSCCKEFEFELNDKTILSIPYKGNSIPKINKKEPIFLKYIDDIPVISYTTCVNVKQDVINFCEKYKDVNFDNVVVDLRGNGGGNSESIKPLLELIKDKNIYVLTDYKIFSSGIFSIYQIKSISKKVTFIGQKVSAPINGFGNLGKELKVHPIGYGFNYSIKYFDLDPYYDENKENICIKSLEELKDSLNKYPELTRIRYYEPDINIEPTIEDIRNNNDPILYTAIEMIKENIKVYK